MLLYILPINLLLKINNTFCTIHKFHNFFYRKRHQLIVVVSYSVVSFARDIAGAHLNIYTTIEKIGQIVSKKNGENSTQMIKQKKET